MINPHLLTPKYGKVYNHKAPGGKFYMAHVGHVARKVFRTATDALRYANRLVIRWRRLYDAVVRDEEVLA